MILLDGKKLAEKILAQLKGEIAAQKKKLRLGVIVVGEDPVVRSFIAEKKKVGDAIGVDVRIFPFDAAITTNELRKRVAELVHEPKNTGLIIQLPLPAQINKQYILNSIVPEKDVDVLSARAIGSFVVGKHLIMPPVAGAIKALLEEYEISYQEKRVAIVGAGSLVGRPLALWLMSEGVNFTLLAREAERAPDILRAADIIISGIGQPKFLKGDMVKSGAVVIDAGTSESEGKMVGDVDLESVGIKAAYISPVPGGVGPLTVATLFKNLITLAHKV